MLRKKKQSAVTFSTGSSVILLSSLLDSLTIGVSDTFSSVTSITCDLDSPVINLFNKLFLWAWVDNSSLFSNNEWIASVLTNLLNVFKRALFDHRYSDIIDLDWVVTNQKTATLKNNYVEEEKF